MIVLNFFRYKTGLLILLGLSMLQAVSQTPRFKKNIIRPDFIAEGVAIADVNKDGKPDILAGAYWFEGPRWILHEIAEPRHFSAKDGYSNSF